MSLKLEDRRENLPSNWERVAIGEVCELGGGKTPKKSEESYWGGETLWISPKDFDGTHISSSEDKLTEQALTENSINIYNPGSIALVVRSGVLRHSLPLAQLQKPAAVNQDIKVLQPDTNLVLEDYLLALLIYESNRIRTSCAKTGTTVESIETSFLKGYKIPLPPIPEQRQIAEILSTVDKESRQTETIISTVRELKKGLTQDFIHLGTESRGNKEIRVGPLTTRIPTDWDLEIMGDLCEERQLGTSDRGASDTEDNILLIKMGNLTIGGWDLSETEYIKCEEELEKYQLKKGDMLFNTRNSPELVGKTAVWDSDKDAVFDNNLLRLRFSDKVHSSKFVNTYLSSGLGRRYLRSLVHGTTSVAAIYWKDLENLKVPIPPIEEQQEITKTLDLITTKIQQEQEKKQHLQKLKRGLMQDLLTGKVRVNDINLDNLNQGEPSTDE